MRNFLLVSALALTSQQIFADSCPTGQDLSLRKNADGKVTVIGTPAGYLFKGFNCTDELIPDNPTLTSNLVLFKNYVEDEIFQKLQPHNYTSGPFKNVFSTTDIECAYSFPSIMYINCGFWLQKKNSAQQSYNLGANWLMKIDAIPYKGDVTIASRCFPREGDCSFFLSDKEQTL